MAEDFGEALALPDAFGEPEALAEGDGDKDGLGLGEIITEASGDGVTTIGWLNLFLSQTK